MDLVLYDNNSVIKGLSGIFSLLKCNIMLLREDPKEFFLECGDNHMAPQRDICTASFKIKLLWNRQHYECLVEANKLRGKIYSTLKSFSQIFQFHLSSTHFLRQSKIKVTLAYDTFI